MRTFCERAFLHRTAELAFVPVLGRPAARIGPGGGQQLNSYCGSPQDRESVCIVALRSHEGAARHRRRERSGCLSWHIARFDSRHLPTRFCCPRRRPQRDAVWSRFVSVAIWPRRARATDGVGRTILIERCCGCSAFAAMQRASRHERAAARRRRRRERSVPAEQALLHFWHRRSRLRAVSPPCHVELQAFNARMSSGGGIGARASATRR